VRTLNYGDSVNALLLPAVARTIVMHGPPTSARPLAEVAAVSAWQTGSRGRA
jgi:hypothetical protein